MDFVANDQDESAIARQLTQLGVRQLQRLTHGLIREWTSSVAISPRADFVDFRVESTGVLGSQHAQRFRLFKRPTSRAELRTLIEDANALGLEPVAVIPVGMAQHERPPADLQVILPTEFLKLCQESALIYRRNGQYDVDQEALSELKDEVDSSLALLNGLLWLRPLSRDRKPPALRWTAAPAHELFERCFFLTVTSTFLGRGVTWGTRDRGKAAPDGALFLPGHDSPIIYDCKASRTGYEMSMKDLRTAADYLQNPPDPAWKPEPGQTPWFLVISSEIEEGSRNASFAGRQRELARRVPNAKLAWMRVRDLTRFGLAIERASIPSQGRSEISWTNILNEGSIRWSVFESELVKLRQLGFNVGTTT